MCVCVCVCEATSTQESCWRQAAVALYARRSFRPIEAAKEAIAAHTLDLTKGGIAVLCCHNGNQLLEFWLPMLASCSSSSSSNNNNRLCVEAATSYSSVVENVFLSFPISLTHTQEYFRIGSQCERVVSSHTHTACLFPRFRCCCCCTLPVVCVGFSCVCVCV